MKARLNSAPLWVTITLLSALVGGCGSSGGDKTSSNVQPSPQPVASPAFPSPTVPNTVKSPAKIALTRPTNPDDRLRVIKSGRNDPFLRLAEPKDVASKGSGTSEGGSEGTGNSTEKSTTISKFSTQFGPAQSSGNLPSLGQPGKSEGINLPSLPAKPELAAVKVTGVVEIAGMPRAIVEAPDEKTSRTVGVGDSLSGGKLYVKNIDLSNRAEPMVIFQQGDTQFSVAVGREPVLMASAATGSGNPLRPVRGLYSTQAR